MNEDIGKKVAMFSPGIEPGTFRVLGGCDNHYTTKTSYLYDENSLIWTYFTASANLSGLCKILLVLVMMLPILF